MDYFKIGNDKIYTHYCDGCGRLFKIKDLTNIGSGFLCWKCDLKRKLKKGA